MLSEPKINSLDVLSDNREEVEKLNETATWIAQANTLLIVAGHGIVQDIAVYNLVEFATQLQIPIVSALPIRTAIPTTHPLFQGVADSPRVHRRCCFDWVDLVIAVGLTDMDYPPQFWNPDGDIPTIHIGNAPAVTNCYYQPRIELIGNLSSLLAVLLQKTNRQGKPATGLAPKL